MPVALVDVLIPVFNAASYLEKAMNSVLGQTLDDIRIVVVDDGSTDQTPQILADFARRDHRIYIITQVNAGIEAALNRGLAACSADFIARFDADDICFPNRMADQVNYLNEHPECIAVDGSHWQIDGEGNRTGFHSPPEGPVSSDAFSFPAREPYLTHPFLMVRRSAIESAGGYRYVFRSQDADLYWRLIEIGKLHHSSFILGEYRSHSESVSSATVARGRISATNSQLAALSYRRRQNGLMDIDFPASLILQYQNCNEFEQMVDISCKRLNSDEINWYKLAAATKFLELSVYRTYHLTKNDVNYIIDCISKVPFNIRKSTIRNKLKLLRKLANNHQWGSCLSLMLSIH